MGIYTGFDNLLVWIPSVLRCTLASREAFFICLTQNSAKHAYYTCLLAHPVAQKIWACVSR